MARPADIDRRRVLKSGALMAAGCAWPSLIRAESSEAEQTWTLGNDLVQRVVGFQAGHGLYTKQIACFAMHKDYIARGNGSGEGAGGVLVCVQWASDFKQGCWVRTDRGETGCVGAWEVADCAAAAADGDA